MADHSKPLVTSTYANFVSELDGRFDDLTLWLDSASTSPTNLPSGAKRWNSTAAKWEKWGGSAWSDLATAYAINLAGPIALTANSSSNALRITQTGTGNALVVEDSANPDSTPFVVDTDGRVGNGIQPVANGWRYQQLTTNSGLNSGGAKLTNIVDNLNSAWLSFEKSRGSIGSPTGVSSGDYLGGISFQGYYGGTTNNYQTGAYISGVADAAQGDGSSAGRLEFSTTPSGSTTPVERLRISQDGTSKFSYPVSVEMSSSSTALRVTQTGTGNALVVEDSANPDSTPFVIDAAGRVVNGHTSAIATGSLYAPVQSHGISSSGTTENGFGSYSWQNGNTGSGFSFHKARGGVIGTPSVVSSGDFIGRTNYYAYDGSSWIQSATIDAIVDGSPSTNNMPGRLVFQTTPSSSTSAVEHLRISSDGIVDLRKDNTAGTALNILRFTDTDTTAAAGQDFGQIQFYSSDASGVGVKAYIKGKAVGTNPGGYLEFGASANTAGVNATAYATLSTTAFSPVTDNTIALGTSAIRFSNCYTNGVGFPATQVASADANTLDDYERGSFTPTIVGGTTAGTGTYTTQTGFYIKVGRFVYVNIWIVITAHDGTGQIQITGLPYASASVANGGIMQLQIRTTQGVGSGLIPVMNTEAGGNTYLKFSAYNPSSGGLSSVNVANGSYSYNVTGTYHAAT